MHEGSMQTTKGKAVTALRKTKTRTAETRPATFSVYPGAFESANNGKDLWTPPKASCEPDKQLKDGGFTRVRDIGRIALSGGSDYAWIADDREALAAVKTGATTRSCSRAARRGRNETAFPRFQRQDAAFEKCKRRPRKRSAFVRHPALKPQGAAVPAAIRSRKPVFPPPAPVPPS